MPSIHIDVFFQCLGKTYGVGHGDIPYSENPVEQAGSIASILHEIAWQYEESAQKVAEDGDANGDILENRPRKAWNRAGDLFFEVSPDEFVAGMSYEDAIETYRVFGGGSTLEQLQAAFPGLGWDDIE
jgi:hypothetical protein